MKSKDALQELLRASVILNKTDKLCKRLTMFWHCIEQVEIPVVHAKELWEIMSDVKEIQDLFKADLEDVEEYAKNSQETYAGLGSVQLDEHSEEGQEERKEA